MMKLSILMRRIGSTLVLGLIVFFAAEREVVAGDSNTSGGFFPVPSKNYGSPALDPSVSSSYAPLNPCPGVSITPIFMDPANAASAVTYSDSSYNNAPTTFFGPPTGDPISSTCPGTYLVTITIVANIGPCGLSRCNVYMRILSVSAGAGGSLSGWLLIPDQQIFGPNASPGRYAKTVTFTWRPSTQGALSPPLIRTGGSDAVKIISPSAMTITYQGP